MARLFNLESYIECCEYAHLFEQSPEHLIPSHGDLPRSYKTFLRKYADSPYIPEPMLGESIKSSLEIRRGNLDYSFIGTELSQGDERRLFIIRDTVDLFTLSTSNLLDSQETYLYSSAYHYWNHFNELSQHNLTQPIVFIDLDSFGCDRVISIQPNNSPNKVPILNTREPISLQLTFNPIEIYNTICKYIAGKILKDNFPRLESQEETIRHLSHYLQRIAVFQILQQNIDRGCVDLVVEILRQDNLYYKTVNLSFIDISQIILKTIDFSDLLRIAKEYSQYNFAIVSQYNIFPNIRQQLPGLICLNPASQNFDRIWQQRQESNFPLYGIYLDKIEFAIGITDSTGSISKQWIQLGEGSDTISYEGNQIILTGRIPETNQDTFNISQGRQAANLPIRINGEDYCRNGVPQDYTIEIENAHTTEDVLINIEFNQQPGSFPQLRVTDLAGRYKIRTRLSDRKKVSYSYIPPQRIAGNRQEESLKQIKRLNSSNDYQQFKRNLLTLIQLLTNREVRVDLNRLCNSLQGLCNNLRKNGYRLELLQYVYPLNSDLEIVNLQQEFQNESLKQINQLILQLIQKSSLSEIEELFLNRALIFVGRTYNFSTYLGGEDLFLQADWRKVSKIPLCRDQYLICIARIALNKNCQQNYFSLFEDFYNSGIEQNIEKYLWGYARILLWHYNFSSASTLFNYEKHFNIIAEGLIKTDRYQYQQNAFLSLTYLLSFRAVNNNFCSPNSTTMEMAHKVIERFQNESIKLNQVSLEKSLNQIFQELIEGTASEDDVENLVQAG